jgi:hypothetical protein
MLGDRLGIRKMPVVVVEVIAERKVTSRVSAERSGFTFEDSAMVA